MTKKKLEEIEKALKQGATLHAFRSGAGLLVVRVEGSTKDRPQLAGRERGLWGYGEYISWEGALEHCAQDLAVGGQPYNEVYGENGKHAHYLTGSSGGDGGLDEWLSKGNSVDAYCEQGEVVVVLKGYTQRMMVPGWKPPLPWHEQAGIGYSRVRPEKTVEVERLVGRGKDLQSAGRAAIVALGTFQVGGEVAESVFKA